MLETVSKGFKAARNKLKGRTEITPEVVDEALRDIRVSLLEADVAFDVVKRFVARVREKAIGELGFEPGGLGWHDLTRIGDGYQISERRWVKRERDRKAP